MMIDEAPGKKNLVSSDNYCQVMFNIIPESTETSLGISRLGVSETVINSRESGNEKF